MCYVPDWTSSLIFVGMANIKYTFLQCTWTSAEPSTLHGIQEAGLMSVIQAMHTMDIIQKSPTKLQTITFMTEQMAWSSGDALRFRPNLRYCCFTHKTLHRWAFKQYYIQPSASISSYLTISYLQCSSGWDKPTTPGVYCVLLKVQKEAKFLRSGCARNACGSWEEKVTSST